MMSDMVSWRCHGSSLELVRPKKGIKPIIFPVDGNSYSFFRIDVSILNYLRRLRQDGVVPDVFPTNPRNAPKSTKKI